MARTNHGSYSFLEFTLDPAAERLFRGPDEIKLRPKSFQVILYLLEHHGRLVTREELLQAIWGDVVVTDESITKCIAEIRKALGDESQEIIRTVTRRGFLFEAQVRLVGSSPEAAQGSSRRPGRRFPGTRALLAVSFAIPAVVVLILALRSGYLSAGGPTSKPSQSCRSKVCRQARIRNT